MLANNLFIYKGRGSFCSSFRDCTSFWPLCQIIHCHYYIFLSSLCTRERSYKINSYLIKWTMNWYGVQEIISFRTSSSLTGITRFHIFLYVFVILRPIILFFDLLKHSIGCEVSTNRIVVHHIEQSWKFTFRWYSKKFLTIFRVYFI